MIKPVRLFSSTASSVAHKMHCVDMGRHPMTMQKSDDPLSRYISWLILLTGLFFPWVIAAWVKISLLAQGSPTWPMIFFIHPRILMVEVPATVYWALPFICLALLSRYGLEMRLPLFNLSPGERLFCITVSFLAGLYRGIPFFYAMFLKFHPIAFLYPWFISHGGLEMLLALVGGWILLGVKNRCLA